MIAVYPLVTSDNGDLELLLSVKTLRRLQVPVSKVVVVGSQPQTWHELRALGIEIDHLHHRPSKATPVKDVLDKLMAVCHELGKDKEFLFFHDDMMVLQENAIIKHEQRGTIVSGAGYWGFVAKNTLKRIGVKGPRLNYECHTPIMIQTDRFLDAFKDRPQTDLLIKSVYLNHPGVGEYHKTQGIPVVKGLNRKMRRSERLDEATINGYRAKTAFLSLSHRTTNAELVSALEGGWI